MKPTNPTRPTRSTIPCYAADGTPLGYRSLDAAQHLVASGYVRPSWGRKGHLRAIWLLRDDGTNPVQSPRPQRHEVQLRRIAGYRAVLAAPAAGPARHHDQGRLARDGARPFPPGGARLPDFVDGCTED